MLLRCVTYNRSHYLAKGKKVVDLGFIGCSDVVDARVGFDAATEALAYNVMPVTELQKCGVGVNWLDFDGKRIDMLEMVTSCNSSAYFVRS